MNITVCLFAHPDDEAFGPGGTIAQLSKTQNVYIICVTNGESGGSDIENLGDIRAEELKRSAALLGVKEVFFLNYPDGELCNNVYHDIGRDIEKHLNRLSPQTLITYEPLGVSGHIDHIVVSMIAHYLFERLDFVKKLMMYCHDIEQMTIIKKHFPSYFVYMPPGYPSSEIGERIDTQKEWDVRQKAIQCHMSQINDVKRILFLAEELPKEELFLVRKK